MEPISTDIPKFVKLSRKELNQLPGTLLNRMPKASQLYNILKIFLDGDLQNAYPEPEFYAYINKNNDLFLGLEKTCIVAKLSRFGRSDVEWIILAGIVPSHVNQEIIETFCHIINWDVENSFNALDTELTYLKICCKKYGSGDVWSESGTTYCMTVEEGLNLDLTTGDASLEIKSLEPQHIPLVVQNWIYASKNSAKELSLALKYTGSVGLFSKSPIEGEDDELIGWCFYLRDGGIHILHTMEKYRGKGYGKLLLKAICKLVSEKGYIPFTHVADGNVASISTQLGIGLRFSHDFEWTIYRPPKHATEAVSNININGLCN